MKIYWHESEICGCGNNCNKNCITISKSCEHILYSLVKSRSGNLENAVWSKIRNAQKDRKIHLGEATKMQIK